MKKTILQRLRENTAQGYNLAAIVSVDHDINDLTVFEKQGLPVLTECKDAASVLRNLEISGRCSGIYAQMAETGEEFMLLHLVFTEYPGTQGYLNYYRLTIHHK